MQKNKLAMCKRIFKDFQAKKLVDDKIFWSLIGKIKMVPVNIRYVILWI